MAKEKILIVEDDRNISKLIKYNLDNSGYESVLAKSGEEALDILNKEPVSLVILDIMLPEISGFNVCRKIKQDNGLKNIPVIMLTAKGEEVDRIVGLELGADDYVVKPFSPRELVLRIKAVLKRIAPEENGENILDAGGICVDIDKHKVTVNRKEIVLTPLEFKLLVTFIRRRGRVQTRDNLLQDVWNFDSEVDTRTIDTHIKRLREKLGKSGNLIETVRGLGYRFKEE